MSDSGQSDVSFSAESEQEFHQPLIRERTLDSIAEDPDPIPTGPFVYKYESKVHAYSKKLAPYPFSYDPLALDADILNNVYVKTVVGSTNLIQIDDSRPTRVLDVGCGTGYWILDAVSSFPSCSFVGFDLCPIQPDLSLLDSEIASRITWKHGNFLEKWPFEDNSFDYLFARRIAAGVPEEKWNHFFQEAARVLVDGGKMEYIEDDIIFPQVPADEEPPPPPPVSLDPPKSEDSESSDTSHRTKASFSAETGMEEEVLEDLFYEVFRQRKINLRPSSVVAGYVDIYFRQTTASPVASFPLPYPESVEDEDSCSGVSPSSKDNANPAPTENADSSQLTESQRSNSSASVPSTSSRESATSSSTKNSQPPTSQSSSHGRKSSLATPGFVIEPFNINAGNPRSIPHLPFPHIMMRRRDLAIHLLIAFSGVLACKEAMWEVLVRRSRWPKRSRESVVARESFERGLERLHARIRRLNGKELALPIDPADFAAFKWEDYDVGSDGEQKEDLAEDVPKTENKERGSLDSLPLYLPERIPASPTMSQSFAEPSFSSSYTSQSSSASRSQPRGRRSLESTSADADDEESAAASTVPSTTILNNPGVEVPGQVSRVTRLFYGVKDSTVTATSTPSPPAQPLQLP